VKGGGDFDSGKAGGTQQCKHKQHALHGELRLRFCLVKKDLVGAPIKQAR
jgi:hypothetical protein